MSSTAAAQKGIKTSIRRVPLKLITGMVLLVVSVVWALSMILTLDPESESVLKPIRDTVLALSGIGAPVICVLMLWGAVLCLASAYHPVSRRGLFLTCLIYLFLTAALEILMPSPNNRSIDLISEINLNADFVRKVGTSGDLALKYHGFGNITFLIAWPLYQVNKIFGFTAALLLTIIFIFMFFRTNPVKIFEKISNALDRHEKKKWEKEKARAQETEENGQTGETRTPGAVPAYASAPASAVRSHYRAAAAQPVYGYEPDPYDNGAGQPRQPVTDAPAPIEDDYWGPSGAYPASQADYAQPSQRNGNGRTPEPVYPEHAPAAAAANRPQVPAPVYPDDLSADNGTGNDDGSFDFYPEEEETHDAPAPRKPAPVKREEKAAARPAASSHKTAENVSAPAVPPAAEEDEDGEEDTENAAWTDFVRRREQQAFNKKNGRAGGTAKADPEPVYTDPVMPITGEKVKLNTRSEAVPAEKPSLDGRDKQKAESMQMEMKISSPYVFPKMELLSLPKVENRDESMADQQKAQAIEDTLASFHIESKVMQITHGPSITRFALSIAPGVKVSNITGSMASNIGLTLGTNHIRMESPIQGTSYIGIELPNEKVTTVSLREVLESPEMKNNSNPLLVALGKDIAGTPVLCDLSKMIHTLIAGATGSGKSVCINSIVCSLLYRATPEQVRMIMIDPKQVELQVYNGIPHLLTPVVCDPKKAAAALNWVVNEMFERYNIFSANKVRNLTTYNKIKAGTGEVMPNIVVIIDEMADLMEVCRKEVEESIRRLAALARAAGIFLVLATQRPSVDVISGVIRNNIPSRIAFAVSSGTDSRTILDSIGAEKLVGRGDMLFKPAGSEPRRVQGCFVKDEEVEAITEFVAANTAAQYDPDIQEQLDSVGSSGRDRSEEETDDGGDGSEDELLLTAIEMAVEDRQTSTSMLQRRLRIGYARAGRLVDEMEKRGIVAKSEGSKPRKTIITREQYMQLYGDGDSPEE